MTATCSLVSRSTRARLIFIAAAIGTGASFNLMDLCRLTESSRYDCQVCNSEEWGALGWIVWITKLSTSTGSWVDAKYSRGIDGSGLPSANDYVPGFSMLRPSRTVQAAEIRRIPPGSVERPRIRPVR